MIGPEHESPRPATGEGFADVVHFAFGDPESELFGLARIGLSPGPQPTASALAVLFSGREPAAARARGGAGFELEFRALSEPLAFGADGSGAPASGMEGYEQLCRVEGEAAVGGRRVQIACLGQRGHSWGEPDWKRMERMSTVAAWLGEDRAVALEAIRREGERGHDADAVRAFLVEEEVEGDAVVAHAVADPRLSTTYDAEGHQRRAGLELWLDDEDELPRRAAGEVLCGTSLELGRLQLDCAFFAWTMEGRAGVGPYEVVRWR